MKSVKGQTGDLAGQDKGQKVLRPLIDNHVCFCMHVYISVSLCVFLHTHASRCMPFCVHVKPDIRIDKSLLGPGRRLASLEEALNKQRIEMKG